MKQGSRSSKEDELDSLILNEVQLLLAEKRTSLSTMRTGIAILVLPLSVFSVLVATSRFYDALKVLNLLLPLIFLCAGLVVLAVWLIIAAMRRLYRYDSLITALKRKHSKLAEFLD